MFYGDSQYCNCVIATAILLIDISFRVTEHPVVVIGQPSQGELYSVRNTCIIIVVVTVVGPSECEWF